MLNKIKLKAKNWASGRGEIEDNLVQKKLTMCKKCYTFYYKNSWHFDRPAYLEIDEQEDVRVRFTECPACLEQDLAFYESDSLPVWRRVEI